MFYLMMLSTHFIYSYMASDIWWRTTQIAKEETRCRHIGYSFQLAARVLLYASSHRQDNTYNGLCYTSRGGLAGMRNISMGSTMKDRSDDPSHHKRMLLPQSYISLTWYRTTQIVRGNLLPPHGILFPINSKGSFICTIPDRIALTTGLFYTSRGGLAGTRNSSMGYIPFK